MSNALALAKNLASSLNVGDGAALLETLKATAFKGNVNDAQMTALLIVAQQYQLNPWTKEIYAFPDRNNGIVPVVGVDGWSRIINSNPQFDGMSFDQDDDSCTCRIYRKDRSHPVEVTEWMAECKRDAPPWKSHPKRMLRHKAMIQCARLAFGFAGIFDQDEAERISEIDVTPRTAQQYANAVVIEPDDSVDQVERENLIKTLETVVEDNGMEGYRAAWMSLSNEQRVMIGESEHARLKSMAAKEATNG